MAQFTNQATISYNGQTVNSNIVTGELTQALAATKNATVDSYRAGDILNYVVTIRNTGVTPYTGLTITDNLGAYQIGTPPTAIEVVPLTYTGDAVLYYVNGVLQASPAVTAGPPMTITGINVPAGGTATIVYRARANEFAPLGTDGSIDNEISITGGGLNEAVTADESVDADTAAELTVLKALSPSNVVENGPITYTFTIQNTGATAVEADADLVITDDFTPALDAPITVTVDGTLLTQAGNYTYDADTGLFATTAGVITVPAATYTQDPTTGTWTVTPGVTVVTVTGTV